VARIRSAVFDTGPVIHLGQVDSLKALGTIKRILVPEEVVRELRRNPALPPNCSVTALSGKSKDLAKIIGDRYEVDPGESAAIALARQEGVRLLFTDDLEAREVAKEVGLEPHGSLALVTRAYREGILNRNQAVDCIERLHTQSSLYLTSGLVAWAKPQIIPRHPRTDSKPIDLDFPAKWFTKNLIPPFKILQRRLQPCGSAN
jgi:predicted nucleic acid-binding protein